MNLATLTRARRTRPLTPAVLIAILVVACGGTGAGGSPATTAVPSDAAVSASGSRGDCPTSQPDPLPAGETRTVTIETSLGNVVVSIDGSLSPIAAGNFVALAECGFYDGVGFHRLVPGFVIQGGDPDGTGTGGPGYTIEDEPVTSTYHRGTLAMARTQEPNSQGSQFFVVLDDEAAQALASYNNYAIFGEVADGMDVVDAIAATPNSGAPNNAALDPITMDRVTVSTP